MILIFTYATECSVIQGEEVKLSISCRLLFLENWSSVYICETAVSRKSTLCQAAVLLQSEGDGSKGQSRWWSQKDLQLELSGSEEGTGCSGGNGDHAERMSRHSTYLYIRIYTYIKLLTSISNYWRGRVGRAWAVFQDVFSDVLRRMIVSHFLCLNRLAQFPGSEIWT